MHDKQRRVIKGSHVAIFRSAAKELCGIKYTEGYEVAEIARLSGVPETTVRRWLRQSHPEEYLRRKSAREETYARLKDCATKAAHSLDSDQKNISFEERISNVFPDLTPSQVIHVRKLARKYLERSGYGFHQRQRQKRDTWRDMVYAGAPFGAFRGQEGGSKGTLSWLMKHPELSDTERLKNREMLRNRSRSGKARKRRSKRAVCENSTLPGVVAEREVAAEISHIIQMHRPDFRVEKLGDKSPEDLMILFDTSTGPICLPLQVRSTRFSNGSLTASVRKGRFGQSYTFSNCRLFVAYDPANRSFYCVNIQRVHTNTCSVNCRAQESFDRESPQAFLDELQRAIDAQNGGSRTM